MNTIGQFFLYALLAVTAENVIFSGGIGFSRVLRAAQKPYRLLMWYGFLVTVFSVISMLVSLLIMPVLAPIKGISLFRPAIFGGCTALIYIAAAFILKQWFPRRYRRLEPVLSSAAINCLVLSLPFLSKFLRLGFWESLGFAFGTGAAFLLSALLVAEAMAEFRDKRIPKAFQGLPATLIYVGILSMAVVGFSGGRYF